jgi:tetratricopeptide (TPR) repeat protein
MRIVCSFLLVLIFSGTSSAQTDLELAEYYYNNGSYEQALLYLGDIYKKNKTNKVYQMYYESLLAMDNFRESEKLVKGRLKRRHKNSKSTAYVDLGALYVRFDMKEKALEAFDDALEILQPGKSAAVRLANAFVSLDELDLAYDTYTKAIELGTTDFHFEFANLQGMRGDYRGMVESFMELLNQKPTYILTVQTSLNRNLRIEEDRKNSIMVRGELLRAAKRYPEKEVYPQMLVWYFTQEKDFNSAFIHARSLDMRLKEHGARIMELGNTAAANNDLEAAIECFNYVAGKGPNEPYFFTARNELLQVRFHSLKEETPLRYEKLNELEVDYASSLRDLGSGPETSIMVKNHSHLLAFYLDRSEEAMVMLEKVLMIPNLNPRVSAACKLELGDVYVFADMVWDASLIFSQVVLDFKDDPLGHEAKYRNARISYYTGDFAWAQTQLDALKASTSKLISNDAIDLSLLITDNFNLDTIFEPMEMYARADLLIMQRRFEDAKQTLDTLILNYPSHSLEDEILMVLAELALQEGDIETAIAMYSEVVELHFDDITGDDALYNLAIIYDEHLGDLVKAEELYSKLLFDFSGSLYTVEARKRFRELNGELEN